MTREKTEEIGVMYLLAKQLLQSKSIEEVKSYMKKKYGATYYVDKIIGGEIKNLS